MAEFTKTTNFAESALIDGKSFYWTTSSVSMTGSVPKVYRLTTPSGSAGKKTYLDQVMFYATDTEARIQISIGTISSSVSGTPLVTRSYAAGNGTAMTTFNANGESPVASTVLADNATFLANGVIPGPDMALFTASYTTIWQGRMRSGSYVMGEPNLALRGATNYEIKVTNLGIGTNLFDADIRWVETT